jgi:hypothetical protein
MILCSNENATVVKSGILDLVLISQCSIEARPSYDYLTINSYKNGCLISYVVLLF